MGLETTFYVTSWAPYAYEAGGAGGGAHSLPGILASTQPALSIVLVGVHAVAGYVARSIIGVPGIGDLLVEELNEYCGHGPLVFWFCEQVMLPYRSNENARL